MDADKPRDVDALIDGVARAMTGGEPSDALRAEVLRQIAVAASAAAAPPPRAITWRPWAVAAAGVVVVAAVVWQLDGWNGKRNDSAAVRQVPDRAAANVPAPARPAAGAAPRDAAVTVTAREPASFDQAAPRAVPPAARQSSGPVDEASTVAIAPLAIDPLRPAALVAETGLPLDDIEIDPIPIRPLALGALASDDVE